MVEILHRHAASYSGKKIKITNQYEKDQENLPSLTSLIDPKIKKEFVKKLFKNDETAFNELLQQLDLIKNWPDAWHKVEIELSKRDANIHDAVAVRLTNILYARYFPENG